MPSCHSFLIKNVCVCEESGMSYCHSSHFSEKYVSLWLSVSADDVILVVSTHQQCGSLGPFTLVKILWAEPGLGVGYCVHTLRSWEGYKLCSTLIRNRAESSSHSTARHLSSAKQSCGLEVPQTGDAFGSMMTSNF